MAHAISYSMSVYGVVDWSSHISLRWFFAVFQEPIDLKSTLWIYWLQPVLGLAAVCSVMFVR